MEKPKLRPEYKHVDRTYQVKLGNNPTAVLAEAQAWIESQTSKATVKIEDEHGDVVAYKERSAKGEIDKSWHLKGDARTRWVVP